MSRSVLTRPEHVRAVFKDSDKHLKAVNNNSGYLMGQVLGQCVGLISLSKWQRVKTVVEAPFYYQTSNNHVSFVGERTERYLNDLFFDNGLSEGQINPVEDLKMLPFLIVAQLLYGELPPDLEQDLRVLIAVREELFQSVIQGGLSRFELSRYLPTKANSNLNTFKSQWRSFNHSAHRHAMTIGKDVPIAHMYEAAENNAITWEELFQTLDEMLFANLDVTMGAVSWTLVFLASSADVQRTLRHDIKDARTRAMAEGSSISKYLLSSSSFLHACILESARLRPLAAFSVPQSAPTSRVIDGFSIPAGTDFIVDTYALNVHNPFWGEDRESYRPARFLERNGPETRYNYWRFGFGPRQCMGKHVADLILRVLVVELLTRYELSLADGGEEWKKEFGVWINHPHISLRYKRLEISM